MTWIAQNSPSSSVSKAIEHLYVCRRLVSLLLNNEVCDELILCNCVQVYVKDYSFSRKNNCLRTECMICFILKNFERIEHS